MDSITQGVLGAAAAQAVLGRRLPRGAGLIGAVGGLIPDLDVFIRSASDPTVGWLFHRHFTHSLLFIPVGGLLAALPFLWREQFKLQRREVIAAALIGYATHAPLDLFTSYGTMLFWPFSDQRGALDWVGIVDPVYTIALIIGLYLTARKQQPRPVRTALLLSSLYLCFGGWQHHRAMEMQRSIAAARSHIVERGRALPAPGSLLLWRSIYAADGRIYADGIRVPWFGQTLVAAGASADLTTFDELPAPVRENAEARRSFAVLEWFAGGWLAAVAGHGPAVGDMRITPEVETLQPLWGLEFDPTTGVPRRWMPPPGQARDVVRVLRSMLFGDSRYRPTLSERP